MFTKLISNVGTILFIVWLIAFGFIILFGPPKGLEKNDKYGVTSLDIYDPTGL